MSEPSAGTADAYWAPARTGESELRDRGSRFRAWVVPVASVAAAEAVRAELEARHHDASHCCWAHRIGWPPAERSSDAGEPRGTAGLPMLRVLRGADLSDVLAVVARWFGGVKLGKGGLARAYGGAVSVALEKAGRIERVARERARLMLPYERLGAVKRLLRPPSVELVRERYGDEVVLELRFERRQRAALAAALADLGLELDSVDP